MDQQLATLRPRHDLRRAINYMTTRWECFERFLDSGDIPFDNNASEQAVKNPVIGKKNWLFFGSPAGGQAAAIFYTLTATCRRLKIDPYAYLKDVFERLPVLMQNSFDPDTLSDLVVSSDLDARSNLKSLASLTPLLPDHWLAEHPESQLQIRTTEANTKSAARRPPLTLNPPPPGPRPHQLKPPITRPRLQRSP